MVDARGRIWSPREKWRLTFKVDETAIEIIAGFTLKNPPHPGAFIKTEIIEGHGLSVTEAAEAPGVTRPTVSQLVNGRTALSPDMALRIEKAFGVRMDALMRMQNAYDITQARRREGLIDVPPFSPKAGNASRPDPA